MGQLLPASGSGSGGGGALHTSQQQWKEGRRVQEQSGAWAAASAGGEYVSERGGRAGVAGRGRGRAGQGQLQTASPRLRRALAVAVAVLLLLPYACIPCCILHSPGDIICRPVVVILAAAIVDAPAHPVGGGIGQAARNLSRHRLQRKLARGEVV